mgnify:CR=1 FL=1
MGEKMGDKAITVLSELMRKYLPKDTYFARLDDANLLAICPKTDLNEMRESLKKIRTEFSSLSGYAMKLDMQSAVSVAENEETDLEEAVSNAEKSMRSRKLMDGSSAHSSLLDSFAQTLKESDSTTQEHV